MTSNDSNPPRTLWCSLLCSLDSLRLFRRDLRRLRLPARRRGRTPFTCLEQADADYAIAVALQEQEVAYAILEHGGGLSDSDHDEYEGGDEGDSAGGGFDHDSGDDSDDLQYEELIALSEVVGIESRGLSACTIASLPSVKYNPQSVQAKDNDQCVICQLEYENGNSLTELPCNHVHHSDCINKWLQMNKSCPSCKAIVPDVSEVCTAEVSLL